MKEYVKDMCVCIVASMLILLFAKIMHSNFFDKLMESFMEVVCGIFAINIASTALIADLINKITAKTGHQFSNTKETLITELKIQAGMILMAVILSVLYYAKFSEIHSPVIYDYSTKIKFASEIGILSIFLYFLWLTFDLGKALFEILKFKS